MEEQKCAVFLYRWCYPNNWVMMMQIQEIGTFPSSGVERASIIHLCTRVKIQNVIKYYWVSTYLDSILRKVSYETDSFKVTTEATNTDELEVFRSTTPCACKTNTKMIQILSTLTWNIRQDGRSLLMLIWHDLLFTIKKAINNTIT